MELKHVRDTLDKMAEDFISQLKVRSTGYLLNQGVFTQEREQGLTFFEYELKRHGLIYLVSNNAGKRVIGLYRGLLPVICQSAEDPTNYKDTAKVDYVIVKDLWNRVQTGIDVVDGKIEKEGEEILDKDPKSALVREEREEEVKNYLVHLARGNGLPNPEYMRAVATEIISITLNDVEIPYFELKRQERTARLEKEVKTSPWGNTQSKSKTGAKGWGSQ